MVQLISNKRTYPEFEETIKKQEEEKHIAIDDLKLPRYNDGEPLKRRN